MELVIEISELEIYWISNFFENTTFWIKKNLVFILYVY